MDKDEKSALVADGLVTIEGAKEFGGWSRSFLYELMNRGELAYVRVGRTRRIPRRALVELASRSLVPTKLGGGQ